MPQPDMLEPQRWHQIHDQLDRSVAEAALAYLRSLASRHIHFDRDEMMREIAELKLGREPNYSLPGFALLYALRYMPRRAISILGALHVTLGDRYPVQVLDVGSGTGATALALHVSDMPRHIELSGIEQSQEMIAFAEGLPVRRRVSTRFTQGSLLDLLGSTLRQNRYDLVVLSAALPYGFDQMKEVAEGFKSYDTNEGTMVLVIEPESKTEFLDAFEHEFKAKGWPTARLCCHDLPDILKQNDIPLKEMEAVAKRIGLDKEEFPIRSWWNPPDDRFLIANPQPAWPLAAPAITSLAERTIASDVKTTTAPPAHSRLISAVGIYSEA